jgi:hypothetical protein
LRHHFRGAATDQENRFAVPVRHHRCAHAFHCATQRLYRTTADGIAGVAREARKAASFGGQARGTRSQRFMHQGKARDDDAAEKLPLRAQGIHRHRGACIDHQTGAANPLARTDQRRPAVRAKLRRNVVATDNTALGCGCGDPPGFGLPPGKQFLQTDAHRLAGNIGDDDRVHGGQMRPRPFKQAEVGQRHPAFFDEGNAVMERPFDSAVAGIDGKDHGSSDFRD